MVWVVRASRLLCVSLAFWALALVTGEGVTSLFGALGVATQVAGIAALFHGINTEAAARS